MSFLGLTSTRLGFRRVLAKDTPTNNPEDQVRLEPKTPELRVERYHLATQDPYEREKKLCNCAKNIAFEQCFTKTSFPRLFLLALMQCVTALTLPNDLSKLK